MYVRMCVYVCIYIYIYIFICIYMYVCVHVCGVCLYVCLLVCSCLCLCLRLRQCLCLCQCSCRRLCPCLCVCLCLCEPMLNLLHDRVQWDRAIGYFRPRCNCDNPIDFGKQSAPAKRTITGECRTFFRCVCWRWESVQRDGWNPTPFPSCGSHLATLSFTFARGSRGGIEIPCPISSHSHLCDCHLAIPSWRWDRDQREGYGRVSHILSLCMLAVGESPERGLKSHPNCHLAVPILRLSFSHPQGNSEEGLKFRVPFHPIPIFATPILRFLVGGGRESRDMVEIPPHSHLAVSILWLSSSRLQGKPEEGLAFRAPFHPIPIYAIPILRFPAGGRRESREKGLKSHPIPFCGSHFAILILTSSKGIQRRDWNSVPHFTHSHLAIPILRVSFHISTRESRGGVEPRVSFYHIPISVAPISGFSFTWVSNRESRRRGGIPAFSTFFLFPTIQFERSPEGWNLTPFPFCDSQFAILIVTIPLLRFPFHHQEGFQMSGWNSLSHLFLSLSAIPTLRFAWGRERESRRILVPVLCLPFLPDGSIWEESRGGAPSPPPIPFFAIPNVRFSVSPFFFAIFICTSARGSPEEGVEFRVFFIPFPSLLLPQCDSHFSHGPKRVNPAEGRGGACVDALLFPNGSILRSHLHSHFAIPISHQTDGIQRRGWISVSHLTPFPILRFPPTKQHTTRN